MNLYKFGSIKIAIDGADEYFKSISKDYENAFEQRDADIYITLSMCKRIIPPSFEKIGEVPYVLAQLSWYKDKGKCFMYGYNKPTDEYVFCAVFNRDYGTVHIDVLDIQLQDTKMLIRNVLDLVLRFVLIPHNALTIHSSAIAYQNKGVLFSAPSGTGKSTHTSLWKQYYPETQIVNDDMPIISFGKHISLCGSPFCGTSGINANITVPLCALVFLRRGTTNKIERINAAIAMRYLIDEIFNTPVKQITDKQFDMINTLLSDVPVYLLNCDISWKAVEAVKEVLDF